MSWVQYGIAVIEDKVALRLSRRRITSLTNIAHRRTRKHWHKCEQYIMCKIVICNWWNDTSLRPSPWRVQSTFIEEAVVPQHGSFLLIDSVLPKYAYLYKVPLAHKIILLWQSCRNSLSLCAMPRYEAKRLMSRQFIKAKLNKEKARANMPEGFGKLLLAGSCWHLGSYRQILAVVARALVSTRNDMLERIYLVAIIFFRASPAL